MILPYDLQALLGDLRGQDVPDIRVLQRLRDINPNFRITWTWATPDKIVGGQTVPGRPGLYWLHEVRPGNKHDELRAAAGRARLERYEKYGEDRANKNPGIPAQCEDMMAGYHGVGQWPKYETDGVPPFGSDRFFFDLAAGEAALKGDKARLDKETALDGSADELVQDEYDYNSEFRQYIRTVAEEFYPYVCKGRKGVSFPTTLKEGLHA